MADIKDIKVDNTEYNIKLPSSRVKSMADYTKPSSAPSPSAIQQSDTLNAAIGKLEYRADMDQTNILYVADSIGKNILDWSILQTPARKDACTITDNSDGSRTFSCSNAAWSRVCYRVYIPAGTWYISQKFSNLTTQGHLKFFITETNSTASGYIINYGVVAGSTGMNQSFVSTGKTYYIWWYLNYSENQLSNTVTVSELMLCTEAAWNISHAYAPYALSNPILTPALIEQVDGGAKNVFEFRSLDDLKVLNSSGTWNNNAYTISGVTFAVDTTNKTIATSGTSTAMISFVIDAYSTATTKFAGYVLSGCPTGGDYDTGYYMYTTDASSNTKDKDTGEGCIIGSTAISRIRIGCRSGVNMGSKTFKPMICTKGAWDVSQKFVPYRPSWDLVGKKTLLSNQCIAGNLSEFNFDVHDYNSGAGATAARYRHGLLVGGTNSNDPILYHVFLDAQNVVTLTPILQGARTFTATCSNDVLTITANLVVYGGLRLVWLD